jgi:predicted Zn-dependent protease
MKKYAPMLALFVVAALAGQMCSSCATNPVTGEQELMLMTEAQEIELGAETHESILATYGAYDDPGLQSYLNDIGQEMAALSHRPHLNWTFTVLDSPVINAFAVPGGYVYVTRGALAHLNNEAELAMVVGHEIGHVTARHSARQYSKQMVFMGGLLLGSLASEEFRDYAGIAGVGLQLLFLKYSRDHERQSDELGVEYAYNAGYDPAEFEDFFRTLNRLEGQQEGGGLSLPGFLSTHPMTENRIADVMGHADRIRQNNPPQGQLVENTERYMRSIDGMVIGEDPRQGYKEGNAFYHPDMNFQFEVPRGWQLQNTPKMVQMVDDNQNAMIIFQLAKGSTPRNAWENIVASNDLTPVDTPGSTRVNGMPGYAGVCSLRDGDNQYALEVLTVEKGGTIFSFIGLTESGDFRRYQDTFVNSFSSFNTVQDRSKLRVEPTRIQVQRVNRAIPVTDFARRVGLADVKMKDFLIMNSLEQGERLNQGSLVKTFR